MNYTKFSINTWKELKSPHHESGGYPSITLEKEGSAPSVLHLFKDKFGHYHFAIGTPNLAPNHLNDPGVNGLQIQLMNYQFHNGPTTQFIDLTCNISGYLEEFTEVVKEVSKAILEKDETPVHALNRIINNWITFWSAQRRESLSEEDQVGLICELLTLHELSKYNPENALKSWIGPKGEKHDFNFTDWNFEVKGTRKPTRYHTINGIDQLKVPNNKSLAFISFQLTTSNNEDGINLPDYIQSLIENFFNDAPNLVIKFNELLSRVGYSPIHADEYRKFNLEVIESVVHEVDEDFPKLTTDFLRTPLSSRVSSVRYDISLDGIEGTNFNDVDWGNYFY